MSVKKVPLSKAELERLAESHPTPFHLYDESGIREAAKQLKAAFSWAPDFKNYFAVKATPNPHIIRLLAAEGNGVDCSSMAELVTAEHLGMSGDDIMFSSNDTPADEFIKARQLGADINLDDITHLDFLEQVAGLPERICFRYNPGPSRTGNSIIGEPAQAKFGLTQGQLFEAYERAQKKGVKHFGLHTMMASNELDAGYLIDTAEMLFDIAVELRDKLGVQLDFINLGGGIGIPYRPEQTTFDLRAMGDGIKQAYASKVESKGLAHLRIVMECGRYLTGPHGYLVTRVLHLKDTYKSYIGVDASMSDLMRPGMYAAYHHITVSGKENQTIGRPYDVTGSLCENNDKFAVDRALPEVAIGDLLVIHDAGAHGHAMGFNYNGKLRSAELLLQIDGSVRQIRRAETLADYFATLDF